MSSDPTYVALQKPPAPGHPVIFAFHGTGGDEHQFFELAQQMVPGAGVVSPRGPVSEMGAARFFRRTGEGVYDMRDLAAQTERMARYVAGVAAAYPGSPRYGFGYSNGANILASVVMTHPTLFSRIGLLHPLIPWQPEPVTGLDQLSILITAGRRDPIAPFPLTDRLIHWFDDQGASVTTEVHDGGHELRPAELSALVKLFSAARQSAPA